VSCRPRSGMRGRSRNGMQLLQGTVGVHMSSQGWLLG